MATLYAVFGRGVASFKVHIGSDTYTLSPTKSSIDVAGGTTVKIKASEVNFSTLAGVSYGLPVKVYYSNNGSSYTYKDYLQSTSVSITTYKSGNTYIKLDDATAGSTTTSYKVKITKGDGISQLSYGINTDSVSQTISNTTTTLDVKKKGGYVYIGIARYSTTHTYPVYAKPDSGNRWTVVDSKGKYVDRKINGPDDPGVREVEIYATPLRYYRVHANANGGSFDGDGNETVWNSGLITEANSSSTIYYQLSNIPTPYRSGYTFAGWGTSSGNAYGSTAAINVSSSSSSNPASLTVYALWTENAKTFKFKLSPTNKGISVYYVYVNGIQKIGSSSTNESTITAYNDDKIRISVTMKGIYDNGTLVNGNGFNVPLITAYADSNSYNDTSEYMTIDPDYPGSATSIPRYEDYSFIAGKRPHHHTFAIGATDKKYNYKIDANEGTWSSGSNPKTGAISSMSKLDLSQFKPTRKTYFLIGWNTLSSAVHPSTSYPMDGAIYLTGDLTLYATWAVRYYIIFHANGGKWAKRATDVKPCEAYYTKIIRLGEKDAGDTQNLSRGGHTLKGWSDSSTTVVKYQPGEQFECPLRTINLDMYAIWEKKSIDKFYWYNNDIQDNTYIAEGKPITNLKASAWNRLKDKIEEVSEATNTNLPSSYSPTRVDSTTEISAKDYNGVRLAIVNFPGAGTGPAVAAKDMVIGASMFVGKNSLKDAINKAIDKWNGS